MWLGSGLAVAVVSAGSCSSSLTCSLGTSICHRRGPELKKKKKMDTIQIVENSADKRHKFFNNQVKIAKRKNKRWRGNL